jgi:hypothetical protein
MDGQQPVTGIADLIAGLETRGISLRVEDGRLRFTAPHGALDDATRASRGDPGLPREAR